MSLKGKVRSKKARMRVDERVCKCGCGRVSEDRTIFYASECGQRYLESLKGGNSYVIRE